MGRACATERCSSCTAPPPERSTVQVCAWRPMLCSHAHACEHASQTTITTSHKRVELVARGIHSYGPPCSWKSGVVLPLFFRGCGCAREHASQQIELMVARLSRACRRLPALSVPMLMEVRGHLPLFPPDHCAKMRNDLQIQGICNR